MRLARTFCTLCAVLLGACDVQSTPSTEADRGADLIEAKGCGPCHSIPGITGADGRVGPPLDHVASRIYIAGKLRNTPANLARWIENPQKVDPGNVMPNMELSASQSRAIAAYLATLR